MPDLIPDTVDQQLQQLGLGQYAQQAQPVKDALVQREQSIVQSILDEADSQGIDTDDLTRFFEGLGMHLPTDQADDGAGDLDETASVLNALVAFAQQQGYRGPVPGSK